MSMLVFLALAFLHQFIEKMAPVQRLALTLPLPPVKTIKFSIIFSSFLTTKITMEHSSRIIS